MVTTRREPVNSITYFNDQGLAKRRLLFKAKLSYTHTIVEGRVQPHQPFFNRLSNSNVKVVTICLRLWCLWSPRGDHQLTA